MHLMDNIFSLHNDLVNKTYKHAEYQAFKINDPKPRDIHKAEVRDRLLNHAIYRVLYPYFDKKFIYDSYSCRKEKGTHKALDRFRDFGRKVSKNNTRTCWVLKCDIKKFFASIDHDILKNILAKHIEDQDVIWLLNQVIDSFHSPQYSNLAIARNEYRGLPLGNLTSQLLVNIYMNKFDQYIKHKLKVKYYIRYADDFVVMSSDKNELHLTLRYIVVFLKQKLKLELHPDKVFIQALSSGVDFLGWVHFPYHKVLRTSTKRRILKGINEKNLPSYLGMLKRGNAYKLQRTISKI